MTKYKKKPVEIDAWKWDGSEESNKLISSIPNFKGSIVSVTDEGVTTTVIHIYTLEGTMTATVGDYIIRGVKGEFYPCKPDIFEMTYESVGPSTEEIDAALAEHNLHEEWLESESSINALKELLLKSLNDNRDEE